MTVKRARYDGSNMSRRRSSRPKYSTIPRPRTIGRHATQQSRPLAFNCGRSFTDVCASPVNRSAQRTPLSRHNSTCCRRNAESRPRRPPSSSRQNISRWSVAPPSCIGACSTPQNGTHKYAPPRGCSSRLRSHNIGIQVPCVAHARRINADRGSRSRAIFAAR